MEKLIKIAQEFKNVLERYEFLKNELYKFENREIEDYNYKEQVQDEIIELYSDIKILLKKILKYSNKNKFYFTDCTKETFLKTLSDRFVLYKKENEEKLPELYDFIIDEIKYLKNKKLRHIIKFENTIVDYTSVWESIFEFKVFLRQKLEVLSSYQWKLENSNNEFFLDDNGALLETTKSVLIVRKICKYLQDYEKHNELYESELGYAFLKGTIDNDIVNADFKMSEKLDDVKYHVTEHLKKLYKQSIEDNYLFFDCPLKVYMNHYEERKNDYLEENIDAVEADFLKKELNILMNPHKERILTINDGTYRYDGLFEYIEFISITNNKKIEYLKILLKNSGWDSIFTEIEDGNGFYDFVKNENYKEDFSSKAVNNFDSLKAKDVSAENNPISTNENNFKSKKQNTDNPQKIKWTAGPSTLGYILGHLDSLGYIETPQRNNGETNYSALARQVLQTFDINSTEDTLKKYLNIDSEKSKQIGAKFEKQGFNIPHSKTIGE